MLPDAVLARGVAPLESRACVAGAAVLRLLRLHEMCLLQVQVVELDLASVTMLLVLMQLQVVGSTEQSAPYSLLEAHGGLVVAAVNVLCRSPLMWPSRVIVLGQVPV